MERNNSITSIESIDRMAIWLGSSVVAAFFSSLERFSCINLSTNDIDDDDDEDEESMSRSVTLTRSVVVDVEGSNAAGKVV